MGAHAPRVLVIFRALIARGINGRQDANTGILADWFEEVSARAPRVESDSARTASYGLVMKRRGGEAGASGRSGCQDAAGGPSLRSHVVLGG